MSGAPGLPAVTGGIDPSAGNAERLSSARRPSPTLADELCAIGPAGTDPTPAAPAASSGALVVPGDRLAGAARAPPADAPIGGTSAVITTGFDDGVDAAHPESHGTLAAAHGSAHSRRAEAANRRDADLDARTAEPLGASPPRASLDTPGGVAARPVASLAHAAAGFLPNPGPAETPEATAPALPVPIGAPPGAVTAWFDVIAEAARPESDGTLAAARASARAYRSRAKADNTRAAYRAAVRAWCAWCDRHGLPPLPAAGPDIATFLADERDRGLAPNTLDLRRAAIRYLHRAAGCPSPTDEACVGETLAGIRRGAPDPRKKRAATLTVLRELLAPIQDDLRGLRDRALLLVGFAGALRRSELAAIQLRDLERTDLGFRLTLARSKGAQTASVTVPLPYGKTELCPVRALTAWLAATDACEGPVFRRIWVAPDTRRGVPPLPRIGAEPLTTRSIGRIVQSRAAAAGFTPREFGGHSLKRGALTTGMERGAHAAQLKRLGRHKRFDVLGEYLEFGNLFDGHPLSDAL